MSIAKERFSFVQSGIRVVQDISEFDPNQFKKDVASKINSKIQPPGNFINPKIPGLSVSTTSEVNVETKTNNCKPEYKKYINHAVETFQKYLGYVAMIDPTDTTQTVCGYLRELDSDKLCDIIMNPMAIQFDLSGLIAIDYTAMGECLTGNEITPLDKKAIANVATGLVINTYDKDNPNVKGYFTKLMDVLPDKEIQSITIQSSLEYYSQNGSVYPVNDILSFETEYPKISNQETLSGLIDNMSLPTRLSEKDQFTEFNQFVSLLEINTRQGINVKESLYKTKNPELVQLSNSTTLQNSTLIEPNLDQPVHWINIYDKIN